MSPDPQTTVRDELSAISHRLRNYAVAPNQDLRDMADRLDRVRRVLGETGHVVLVPEEA
jgi:hypothetical protein